MRIHRANKQRYFITALGALLCSFLWVSSAYAATYYWAGNGSDNQWENAANWSTEQKGGGTTGTAPGASDTADFTYSGTTVTIKSTVSVAGIVISPLWTGSVLQGSGTVFVGSSGVRMGSG